MEPEAKYTLVGSAVLVLLVLVAAAIYWLATSGQGRDVHTYTIYFAHQSLEGLQVRSDVRMKGIRVGAVTAFSFSSTRPGTVQVIIAVDPTTPVKQSTQAVVDRNLITGVAAIRLQNEREDSPPLKAAPDGENQVIAEGASQLQQYSKLADQLAQRADDTMRRIDALLSPENVAAIGETLQNVRDASQGAAGAVKRLDSTLASVGRAADRFDAATTSASSDVHRLATRYDALGTDASTSIRELTGAVKQVSIDVSGLSQRTEGLLSDTDAELSTTAQQLRGTADSLGIAARSFRDPRATFFGPAEGNLGPGEQRR